MHQPRLQQVDQHGEAAPVDALGQEDDEISLVALLNTILRQRYLIAAIALGAALIGATIALVGAETTGYRASATFTPRSGGGDPQLLRPSNLASQFGISTTTSVGSPDFYRELILSRGILRDVASAEYVVETPEGARTGTLVELYDDVATLRSAVGRLRRDMELQPGQGLFIRFAAKAPTPALAEQIAARILEALNNFDRQTRLDRLEAERAYLTRELENARAEYRRAEAALSDFLQSNRGFSNSPDLIFEQERLQRQVAIRQQLVSSIEQSLMQAELAAARDVASLIVVESPEDSAVYVSSGRSMGEFAGIGLMVGLMFGSLLAMVRGVLQSSLQRQGADVAEFARLRREVAEDFRRLRLKLRGG